MFVLENLLRCEFYCAYSQACWNRLHSPISACRHSGDPHKLFRIMWQRVKTTRTTAIRYDHRTRMKPEKANPKDRGKRGNALYCRKRVLSMVFSICVCSTGTSQIVKTANPAIAQRQSRPTRDRRNLDIEQVPPTIPKPVPYRFSMPCNLRRVCHFGQCLRRKKAIAFTDTIKQQH